jgi:hypothetical protein
MRSPALAAFVAALFFVCFAPAHARDAQDLCSELELTNVAQGSSYIPSPCTLAPGGFLFETLYYQNASKVGGTALAAFPLLQVRAGVFRRVDLVLDAPSQIAESGLRGAGVFPRSHASYGARYLFAQMPRFALTASFAVSPPASLYAPNEQQAKYVFDIVAAYKVTPGFTLRGVTQAATSRSVGIGQIFPADALGADLALGGLTLFSTDVGARTVTQRARAQAFTDASVKRMVAKKLMVDVGVGTAFNSVASSKAHYLAAGLSYRP